MVDTMSMMSEFPPVPVSLQRTQEEHMYRHHHHQSGGGHLHHGRCASVPEHDQGYYQGLLLSPAVAATGEVPHDYGTSLHHNSHHHPHHHHHHHHHQNNNYSPCSQDQLHQPSTVTSTGPTAAAAAAAVNDCVSPDLDGHSVPGGGGNSCDERSSPPGSAGSAASGPPARRFGKRRCPTNSNRKERRRTLSINSAFADLRECIPNVPADTKLSKIKTLRLATSYIAYLSEVLAKDDGIGPVDTASFKAELLKIEDRERRKKAVEREMSETAQMVESRRSRGRTGWPQHVWALELQR